MHLNGTEALMNRTSYYKALRSVDPRTQDVTEWLEYFVQGIAVEMVRVESGIQLPDFLPDGCPIKCTSVLRCRKVT
jgi:hypothetical protein